MGVVRMGVDGARPLVGHRKVPQVCKNSASLQDDDHVELLAKGLQLPTLALPSTGIRVKASEERGRIPSDDSEGEERSETVR